MKRMQGRRRIMKEKMNKIPVFYACDDNFVKYTMVSLQSMMDHASKEAQYEIHVLHTNISEEMQKKMYAMENANFSVQFDHVTEYLHSVQEKLPLRDYYSKTTYFRLFIAEMFPEIDKAIYIISDENQTVYVLRILKDIMNWRNILQKKNIYHFSNYR
jgi:lipopolysaccharide biosynthesis glycosyltransferase